MASSLVSYSSSLDDTEHLLSTGYNNPAKRKRKTSSCTPIVQYRRSGQYYRRYSSFVDCESQSPQNISTYSQEKEKLSPDCDGEIREDECKTEAIDDESRKNNRTSNKTLVQALRDLYHFGRTPSFDEISSFASQQSLDNEFEDEERRETKRLRRTDPNELGFVVTDEENSNSTNTTAGDTDSVSEDDGFSYGGLKASDYYSEDLVVEWDSSSTSTSSTTSSFGNDDEEGEDDDQHEDEKTRSRTISSTDTTIKTA